MAGTPASERFEIAVGSASVERVAAILDEPAGERRESAILFAHGAGVDIEHPWMSAMAAALVRRGFAVMRFRYAYMERAARESKPIPPDRAPALEDAHFAALEEFARRTNARRRILAGKSLGARISTHLAAKSAAAHGLALFGYPLHPPRAPEKERSEHFATIVQPALFLQGTRDEFGTPDELRHALSRFAGRATLSIVEGGDHSFELPASAHRPLAATLEELAARVDAWERETWPA